MDREIKQMKQTYSNQEERRLATVLQFFCRSEILKKKKKIFFLRQEREKLRHRGLQPADLGPQVTG